MLKYSERALPAFVRLTERINRLHLFVEDKTCINYYRVGLQRLLPPNLTIRRPYRCGDRRAVIRASQDPRFKRLRTRFFLVDADLYLLCGEKYSIPSEVYVLQSYCFENIFLCLNAALAIAHEAEPDLSLAQLRVKLRLDKWLSKTTDCLIPLFEWYAVAMHFGSQIKTVSVSGLAFLDPRTKIVSKAKVSTKISEIRSTLLATNSPADVDRVLLLVKERTSRLSQRHRAISAKTYLIPLLARYLVSKSRFRDEDGLAMRLAHRFDTEQGAELGDAVIRAARRGN
jgi:hypothetical protein